ncbi:MAG TPA: HU family DNA-binding protein [Stellaceae bacterium]|jgi:DNA-binding protein HU-beta|nr:HU family DNA-binding protein [Stellaceae bacterium]
MSKQVLVEALKATGMRAVDANAAVDTVTETIAGELRKGEKFSIPGFGTFAVSKRAARMGRNPRTGEAIKIKASKGVRFKAGAKLKGSL